MQASREVADRTSILGCLYDCQRDAADVVGWEEANRIGTREVELARGDKRVFRVLKGLRRDGLITRSGGFCWLTKAGRRWARDLR